MSERIDEFAGATVAVVTFTEPAHLAAYRRHLGIDLPIVSDNDRRLYRALGIERGSVRAVWSFGTLTTYARLLRRGRRLMSTREDTRQLGADVVVGADGRIVEIFRPANPAARPTVDELLAALP